MTGPADIERTRTLWFALLLTLANGFLDAHTYIARGGVFANVQTANVIFFAIESSEGKWAAALAHIWPLLAFIAGMALASYIKSGRVEHIVPHALRWTMAVEAVVLGIIGFVPASVPHSYVTVPISFLAAMQIRALPQHRRPRLPAGRDHRQHDAVHGIRVRGVRREARGVAAGMRGLRRAYRRVRHRRARRLRCQPGLGSACDLAARRVSCHHTLSVHRR